MYAEKYMTKCTQWKCKQNFKQRAYRLHIQIINIIIIIIIIINYYYYICHFVKSWLCSFLIGGNGPCGGDRQSSASEAKTADTGWCNLHVH